MHDKSNGIFRSPSITAFVLFGLGSISLIALDTFYWRIHVIAEEWPDFSFDKIIRSVVIFVVVSIMLLSLTGRYPKKLLLMDNKLLSLEHLSIFSTLSISIILLFLFLFNTMFFNAISHEDGPIEWASAILFFICCFIFAVSFIRYRANKSITKITIWTFTFLSFSFFIIAMEEVSWFQRVLSIETPSLFERNIQNEINLHNFSNDIIENIYYFVAFLFLVVLPFLKVIFLDTTNNEYLILFLPRPFVSILGAIQCSYNFDMWNILFVQISFFSAIIILFIFSLLSINWRDSFIFIFTIILMVVTQAIFLNNGEYFLHMGEITEIKEFLIPIAFFWYSLSVYNNAKNSYQVKS